MSSSNKNRNTRSERMRRRRRKKRIIRGGLMSLDPGQMEAGRSLGLNYIDTMRFIVIPQAFKAILPSLGNEFIMLLKETSIAGYVAIQDLTFAGDRIRSSTFVMFLPLLAVALVYLVIVLGLSQLLKLLERRLARPPAPGRALSCAV